MMTTLTGQGFWKEEGKPKRKLEKILKKLRSIEKRDRRGLRKAIDDTIATEVSKDFDEFVEGLELNEDDKFWILGGFVDRKIESFNDMDLFIEFLGKVDEHYKNITRRKKCLKQR
jgi:hypothetical protein